MAQVTRELHTARGDRLTASLVTDPRGRGLIYLTVVDVDHAPVPTVELTPFEAQELRESLRGLVQESVRPSANGSAGWRRGN